jgi:hypothetical protein
MSEKKVRTVAPSEFLTRQEMIRALTLYADAYAEGLGGFAERFCEEVIKPNQERIDKALDQKYDPLYVARAVEQAIHEAMMDAMQAPQDYPM